MKDKKEADGEYWFPAYGFPLYECSNTGKVRNIETKKQLKLQGANAIVTLAKITESGKKVRKNYSMPRLIMQSYTGKKIPKGYCVIRKSGGRSDNHISNLQIVSFAERSQLSGVRHSKPVAQYDLEGNYITTYRSRTMAAKALHIDRATVNNIINKKLTDYGYLLKKSHE